MALPSAAIQSIEINGDAGKERHNYISNTNNTRKMLVISIYWTYWSVASYTALYPMQQNSSTTLNSQPAEGTHSVPEAPGSGLNQGTKDKQPKERPPKEGRNIALNLNSLNHNLLTH